MKVVLGSIRQAAFFDFLEVSRAASEDSRCFDPCGCSTPIQSKMARPNIVERVMPKTTLGFSD